VTGSRTDVQSKRGRKRESVRRICVPGNSVAAWAAEKEAPFARWGRYFGEFLNDFHERETREDEQAATTPVAVPPASSRCPVSSRRVHRAIRCSTRDVFLDGCYEF
jgi:hypothetical protein